MANRIGRIHDVQRETGEGGHVIVAQGLVVSETRFRSTIEGFKRLLLVALTLVGLLTGLVVATGAVASRMHGTMIVETAKTLGGHWTFERVKIRVMVFHVARFKIDHLGS